MSEPVEFSTIRDPDGQPCIDINIGSNVLSISISPRGFLSWACIIPGVQPTHGMVKDSDLGRILYSLLDDALEDE